MIWLALVILLLAALCDLRSRTVPDWTWLALTALGFIGNALGNPTSVGSGLLVAGSGLLVGLVVGLSLYGLARFGGGDARLLAALGAVLGPIALLGALFWMAIAGGVLAVIAAWRGRSDLAYVPAIVAGVLAQALVPPTFWTYLIS
jgi:prepilin peptidase CpaA